MSATDVVRELLLERLVVIGAVFVGLALLVILVAWMLRARRR